MFSGLPDPFRRNVAFRLSLYYALLFTFTSVALFAFAYYLLAATIASKDREVLASRLKEVGTVYEAGGLGGLQNWIRSQPATIQRSLFIRIVSPYNDSAVISAPEDWITLRDVPGW